MSLLVMQPVAAKKGASSVEVYGFAGWILSAVAFALYCLWAFVPEPVLHSIGITYYPTKEWALIIPTLIIFSVLFVYWVYERCDERNTRSRAAGAAAAATVTASTVTAVVGNIYV
eukprot:GHUV01048405.1.p1 GENE.GHUV01048405.1~~GHUV01048405.1.p1  ORF type:complete len:115 (+),score=35.64 GHUV01048405.1:159-503(+)